MRITNRDRLNLARFGCSFSPKQNLILIPWTSDLQKALSAPVLTRSIHGVWPSGPLVCLTLEISRTKALAQYCFFPFNLTDKNHRKYLSTVIKEARITLCFLSESGRITRIHELPYRQCANMAELLAESVADSKEFPKSKYDYERAVSEFEQNVRLVDQFQYVLTDQELRRVRAFFREEAAKVSEEDRVEAAKIASGLIGAFRPHYHGFIRDGIKKLPGFRRSFLLMLDLHREFENDYDGFAQFVACNRCAYTQGGQSAV